MSNWASVSLTFDSVETNCFEGITTCHVEIGENEEKKFQNVEECFHLVNVQLK